MKSIENFKTSQITNQEIKKINGGEYGDVDWTFWGHYFSGTLSAYQLTKKAAGDILDGAVSAINK